MPYFEFTIKAPGESREAISNRLMELGSTGLIEKDGDIVAYFDGKHDLPRICLELERFKQVLESSGLDPGFSFSSTSIPDRDWNEEWKKGFVPFTVGDSITVFPPWEKPQPGRINIVIDPGMAFGTGHHETTRTCLALVEKCVHGRMRMLDVGTGTGILAITAARLGIPEAVAIDNDPLAVEAARHNCELNQVRNIKIGESELPGLSGTFDLITANLISVTLVRLAPEIDAHLNPGGCAILSGILVEQGDEVVEAICKAGLELVENVIAGKWLTLVARKHSFL